MKAGEGKGLLPASHVLLFYAGYGKMPEYEHIFTDFLLSLVDRKYGTHVTKGG